MKRAIVLTLLAGAAPALAQTALPAATPSIFDKAVNAPGIGWSIYGANQTAKQVPAADLPGGAAVRIQVKSAGAHAWDVGAQYPTVKPVAAGDALLVMVFLRAPEVKEGEKLPVPIGAGESDPPYAAIANETVQVGSSWKRYYASGTTARALASGKARITLQLGGARQVVEVGPAFLLDMGAGFDRSRLPHND